MKKELLPQEIRTRVAPSPTGPMHIATARVALYNYIFAKQNRMNNGRNTQFTIA